MKVQTFIGPPVTFDEGAPPPGHVTFSLAPGERPGPIEPTEARKRELRRLAGLPEPTPAPAPTTFSRSRPHDEAASFGISESRADALLAIATKAQARAEDNPAPEALSLLLDD